VTTSDYQIENATGRTVRLDFNDALMALATCNSGAVEPAAPIAGMLWLDTSVLPNGQVRQRNQSNTGWVPIVGVPIAATNAQVIAGTDDAAFVTPAGYTAKLDAIPDWQAFNHIVNGAMQVSQENGDNTLPIVTSGNVYPADQWVVTSSSAPTYAQITAQRQAIATPRGSPYRLRIAVTVAKTVLAASDYLSFWQPIEGLRVDTLGWGAAGAKRVIVRFGFRGPAGTYSVGVRTYTTPYRSYCVPFTISAAQANTDTEQTFSIPGDITGTWPITTAGSIILWITVAAGTTFLGASSVWQTGNYIGATGMSNGLATVNNVFNLFDVGFYVDERQSGVAPRWMLPPFDEDLRDCQRYYVKDCRTMYSGSVTSGGAYYATIGSLPVEMRISTPTIDATNVTASAFPAAAGTVALIALPSSTGSPFKLRENRTANATAQPALFVSNCNISARM
jgi:hypothetical protein